jgi:hypothetical protein
MPEHFEYSQGSSASPFDCTKPSGRPGTERASVSHVGQDGLSRKQRRRMDLKGLKGYLEMSELDTLLATSLTESFGL